VLNRLQLRKRTISLDTASRTLTRGRSILEHCEKNFDTEHFKATFEEHVDELQMIVTLHF